MPQIASRAVWVLTSPSADETTLETASEFQRACALVQADPSYKLEQRNRVEVTWE